MLITEIHWVVVLILLPLFGATACFLFPRKTITLGIIFSVATFASVIGLTLQTLEKGAFVYKMGGWGAPLGIDLYVDGLSLLMLILTSVVGLSVSIYSKSYFNPTQTKYFWPLWMFLWAALNSLFLSSDIFNLFVTLELMGLAAIAMVALSGGANALSSAMRYFLVSLLGSLFYLMGVALLYHAYGSADIFIIAERAESGPLMWAVIGLMTTGLLLKTAIFPMHFWLPSAHSSAPAPVSALLSALVVKASLYILIRLWMEVFPSADLPSLNFFLGLLGVFAILWGGIQALRQTRLKLLIAYSTVMQIGYLFLAFPLASVIGWHATLYMILAHAIAKTAMFMAAGNILYYGGHDRIEDLDRIAQRLPISLAAFGLAGVSLMGLPLTGGFIAKWLLLEAIILSGQWWWGVALIVGGLLTGAYVFKVIGHSFTQAEAPIDNPIKTPKSMEWTAFSMAVLAIALGMAAPVILKLMEIGSPFSGVLN